MIAWVRRTFGRRAPALPLPEPTRDRIISLLEGNLDRLAEIRSLMEMASYEDPALLAQVAAGQSGTIERTQIG